MAIVWNGTEVKKFIINGKDTIQVVIDDFKAIPGIFLRAGSTPIINLTFKDDDEIHFTLQNTDTLRGRVHWKQDSEPTLGNFDGVIDLEAGEVSANTILGGFTQGETYNIFAATAPYNGTVQGELGDSQLLTGNTEIAVVTPVISGVNPSPTTIEFLLQNGELGGGSTVNIDYSLWNADGTVLLQGPLTLNNVAPQVIESGLVFFGLNNNTEYKIKYQAFDVAQIKADSPIGETNSTTDQVKTDTPTVFVQNVGETVATLFVTNNDTSTVDMHIFLSPIPLPDEIAFFSLGPGATKGTAVSGLTEDTTYTFSAECTAPGEFESDIDSTIFRTDDATPPPDPKMATPSFGSLFSVTETTASLNITNQDVNLGDVNSSVTNGSTNDPQGLGGSGGTKTIFLTNLEPGTSHTVTASMSDAQSNKLDSDSIQKTFTTAGTPKLSKPTNLRTSIVSGTEINFLWNAVTNADDYRVESPDGSIVVTSSLSISADRLEAGTFRIEARASGFDDSDEATLIYNVV
jgi:hypothetical protein